MLDNIAFDFKRLAPLVSNLEDLAGRPLPTDSAAVDLLRSYAASVIDRYQAMDVETQHVVAGHFYDLAALAFGARRDGAEVAREGGMRAALLSAIKTDIAKNIGDPAISAEWAALRHGVSPGHVRRLFDRGGTTFSEFTLQMRLIAAHKVLSNPHYFPIPIAHIAAKFGFHNLSHFNRSFRRYYGATPSEVRNLAIRR